MNREPEHLPTPDELAFAEQWMETVDRAARGELDGEELDALERAARTNDVLRDALEDARRMRPHFARMQELAATHALDQRILGAVDSLSADTDSRPTTSHRQVRRTGGPRPRRAIPAWGWTAAAAAIVLLIVWSVPSGIDDPAPPRLAHEFSESEVQAAAEEMEIAMALLGRTMQRTSQRLQQEMSTGVRDTLNDSFRQSFGKTLNQIPYLNPSNDDEEHSGIFIPPRDELHRTLGVALPGERT